MKIFIELFCRLLLILFLLLIQAGVGAWIPVRFETYGSLTGCSKFTKESLLPMKIKPNKSYDNLYFWHKITS